MIPAPRAGADWELEATNGTVDAVIAITEPGLTAYTEKLATLVAGDIAILQVSESNNFFVFAPLVQIDANTTVIFTDRAWSTSANSGAGGFGTTYTWSATTGDEFVLTWVTPNIQRCGGNVVKGFIGC